MYQILYLENEINLINKEYTFEIERFSIKYIVKVHLDEYDNIWIYIFTKDDLNNDIIYHNKLNFEDLENYDLDFLPSFQKNTELFYKFLLRLFNAKLIYIEKSNIDCHLILVLICLVGNEKREIEIFCPEFNKADKDKIKINEDEKIKKNDNIIMILNKKNNIPNPYIFDYKDVGNKKYSIKMSKNEYLIKDSKVYKEIAFEIIEEREKEKTVYYSYLDIMDFLSLS